MKLNRKNLKILIENYLKEAIKSMPLNEDLYASEEEKEEAIKQFMQDNNASREEAIQAIDAAGREMDEKPGWKDSIDLEKEEIQSLQIFLNEASRGKELVKYHEFHGVDPDFNGVISDFKIKYMEYASSPKKFRGVKIGPYYLYVQKGYEVYKTITDNEELFSKYYNLIKQIEAQEDKNIFTKDITLGAKAGALEPEVEALFKKHQEQANIKLAMAAMSLKQQLEGNQYFSNIKKKKTRG